MADQDLDRNEAATPYKLDKAREKGSVAKSVDVNATAILCVATIAVLAWGEGAAWRFAHLSAGLLDGAGLRLETAHDAMHLLSRTLSAGFAVLAPLLMAVLLVAVLANVAQSGFVFSAEPLKPDFTRINPATGFKRIFSLRSIYETGKGILKLALLGGVAWVVVRDTAPRMLALSHVDPGRYPAALTTLVGGLLVKLMLMLLIIAAVDFGFSRRHFARQMRMSRRDIKDEHKNREGDPRIRARIRELRARLLKRSQALRELPGADVLITNPTRVAVALRYEHGVSAAPRVVARGAGSLAAKMRDVAFRHRVPIVPSPMLARALYRETGEGGYVPERWYGQVAKILVWINAAKRQRHATQRGTTP
jgi:flagellar biosynthetic protein FlhB